MTHDPLNMPESDTYVPFRKKYRTTPMEHLNGIMYRIDKLMSPFFEYLGWGLTFMSFLIWLAVIFFFIMLFLAIVIGIGSGILGIDLVPPSDVAAAMR